MRDESQPSDAWIRERLQNVAGKHYFFTGLRLGAPFGYSPAFEGHACNRLGAAVSDEERLIGGSSMQLRLRFTLSFVLLGISTAACFAAPGGAGAEKPASVAVVELFTSEECSSCPPADTLLREINLKQMNAGQLIVGISEHVTYWNDLGWKDPFSSPVFTERQSIYSSRLSLEGPYTPQMVLNGREQFVGSNVGALKLALRR